MNKAFNIKNRIVLILAVLLSMAFVFSGCKSKESDEEYFETTLVFDKNGKITDVIVDTFAESYYSEDGLRAFFQEKISEYNASDSNGSDVTLKELTAEDGKAKAVVEFESADDYTSFYNTVAFYGTVSEAYDKGYIKDITLKEAGTTSTISKNDLMKKSDQTIIIVSEVVRVICPKKILYTSANIELVDSTTARVSSDSSGLAYIIIK